MRFAKRNRISKRRTRRDWTYCMRCDTDVIRANVTANITGVRMLDKLKAMLDRHYFYSLCMDKDRWRGMFTCKRNPKLERIYRFLPGGSRICIHKTYDPT